MPPSVLILCMVAVDSKYILMGSNSGNVYVYNGNERKMKHQLSPVGDAVLCLEFIRYAYPSL